jgi:hypothetical protein
MRQPTTPKQADKTATGSKEELTEAGTESVCAALRTVAQETPFVATRTPGLHTPTDVNTATQKTQTNFSTNPWLH